MLYVSPTGCCGTEAAKIFDKMFQGQVGLVSYSTDAHLVAVG